MDALHERARNAACLRFRPRRTPAQPAACRHRRPLSGRRDHAGEPPAGDCRTAIRPRRTGGEHRRRLGAPRAQAQGHAERARRLHARVRPVVRRRRAADVPGRSAAAHSGRRDGRKAHCRQARRCRLGNPPRPFRIAVRQRQHLGADADRPHRPRAGSGRRRLVQGGVVAAGQSLDRAGRAAGDPFGNADDGQPVRHGPHDQRSAGCRAEQGAAAVPAFLRHARRSSTDRRRCRSLPRGLSRRDQRHRRSGAQPRRQCRGAAGYLGEAVGTASTLRACAARAGAR